MKMILLITLFIGVANAESQCMTKRVPGDKCAVVYLGEDCDDEGSQLEEGWGTVNPPSYRHVCQMAIARIFDCMCLALHS